MHRFYFHHNISAIEAILFFSAVLIQVRRRPSISHRVHLPCTYTDNAIDFCEDFISCARSLWRRNHGGLENGRRTINQSRAGDTARLGRKSKWIFYSTGPLQSQLKPYWMWLTKNIDWSSGWRVLILYSKPGIYHTVRNRHFHSIYTISDDISLNIDSEDQNAESNLSEIL